MLKKIDRLKYMDYLIRIEGTGKMEVFAKKLNVSRSTCGEYLRVLRDMGGKIEYCRVKNTYRYVEPVKFFIGFQNLNDQIMSQVAGGNEVRLGISLFMWEIKRLNVKNFFRPELSD